MPESIKVIDVKVNDFLFSFSEEEIEKADLVKRSESEFHLVKDNQSVNARLVETDLTGKKIRVEVAGEVFDVEIKDELDQMLLKMGFGSASQKHVKEIKAPMPGLVMEVAVIEGQEVLEGDKILILEAMKMENSIIIHANATIKKILVKTGQAVEKGQVLV
ncbi:MAG: biotin/lipoyl-binding protein, partial [Ferruginibacter sp.]|nr:biotin/lipoyl-binding protein [Ferruginibacter sp.]